MTSLQFISLISYVILLWGASITIYNTFISADEVIFARINSDPRR